MTLQELLNYYGNPYRFQKKTGMSYNNVYGWRKRGYIPIVSQMKIETLTNGALTASLEDARSNGDQ